MRAVILVTAGYDHTIRFWEASTGQCYRTLQHNSSQINRIQITRDKNYIAIAANPHVKIYDVEGSNLNPISNFDGHTNNVTAIGFQKDAKWMFSASEDGTIKIWDIRTTGCQRNYTTKIPINSAVLHPNQGEILTGDAEGNLKIWDLTNNQLTPYYSLVPKPRHSIRTLSISSDASTMILGCDPGSLFLFHYNSSLNRYELSHSIEAHNNYMLQSIISLDAKYIATTSSDKTIKIWNIGDHIGLEKTLIGHTRWVWDCVFSADSAYLVSASSDKIARLWDLTNGECVLEYKGCHTKALTCVALNDTSFETNEISSSTPITTSPSNK